MTGSLAVRVAATTATKKAVEGRPFKPGRFDCAQMVRGHLVRMGRAVAAFGNSGSYHSIAGGVRRLKAIGYDDLPAAMDGHFERIAPAAALPGDVIALEGEDGPGALTIYLGNGRVLGFHQCAAGAAVLQPIAYNAAWRVDPEAAR